jgi:hypothetical protein
LVNNFKQEVSKNCSAAGMAAQQTRVEVYFQQTREHEHQVAAPPEFADP